MAPDPQLTRRRFIGAALATGAGLAAGSCMTAPPRSTPAVPVATASPPAVVPAQPPTLLDEAKAALDTHVRQIAYRDRIGLVDFSRLSSEPRFHVVDLAGGRIDGSYLVAHGSGSDPHHTGLLQYFSNQPGSKATSRGAYLTGDPYLGKYGRSQRLHGLDPDNNMALERAIVVHGAPYVDPRMIATHGRIGRSQGCFAFELGQVATIMHLLGPGRMIYASKPA
jgi:hypothetical protein